MLNGRTYKLAVDPTGAGDHLKLRAKQLAKSGFAGMIRPASMSRKPQIYLLDPYDPNKTPLLMVHGLQSTPVAFAALVNALRSDPVIRLKYQTWQFYYASGTPVLANAAELRDSLTETLHARPAPSRAEEQGSDGVVPYWSSHLAGAQSELIVRSGHGVIDNPDAIREVIRILHLQQRSRQNRVSSCAEADSVRFSDQMICLVRFGCNFWPAAGGR